MDAENIKQLQDKWAIIVSDFHIRQDENAYQVRQIRNDLEEMGLDLSQDATYELLDPSLTKRQFDRTHTHLLMKKVLSDYNRAHNISGLRYVDDYARNHFYGLEMLLEQTLPAFEEQVAKTGLPPNADDIELRELAFIRRLHKDGLLEEALKKAANELAIGEFRNAHKRYKWAKKQTITENHLYGLAEGAVAAKQALELTDMAGKYYKPAEVPLESNGFGTWEDETALFSREALEDIRKYFSLQTLTIKFNEASAFQDKGEFVLDASGSGHGMMVMPMQDIAMNLVESGYDLKDPATYTAIGTDIKAFRKAYKDERKAVSKNDKYNLMKPALKI